MLMLDRFVVHGTWRGATTIPHKTIETNKKNPIPSIIVESEAHLGLNIDLGRGESILKESE